MGSGDAASQEGCLSSWPGQGPWVLVEVEAQSTACFPVHREPGGAVPPPWGKRHRGGRAGQLCCSAICFQPDPMFLAPSQGELMFSRREGMGSLLSPLL